MSKQTQGTMLMVGAMAGMVWLVAFVALMVVGDYGFSPALFLSLGVAGVVAIVLLRGFHRKPAETDTHRTRSAAPTPAQHSATAPGASSEDHATGPYGAAPTAVYNRPDPAPVTPQGTVDAPADMTAGRRPQTLSAPRASGADDLKQIKGVGPKLEELCNSMGIYHFDQIAHWDHAEVVWVDDNLEGFKGRVSRDDWVAQARQLAAGEDTDFSKRVESGSVY